MVVAVDIPRDQRSVLIGSQRRNQARIGKVCRAERVFLQKSGQIAIRIQNVRMLIRSIQIALAQRSQQIQRIRAGEQPGGKRRHLTFQHQRQVADRRLAISQPERVIGMIEAVFAAIRPNRLFNIRLRQFEECEHLLFCQRRRHTGNPLLIVVLAIRAPRFADGIHKRPPRRCAETGLHHRLKLLQPGANRLHKLRDFCADFKLRVVGVLEHLKAKADEAPQIA